MTSEILFLYLMCFLNLPYISGRPLHDSCSKNRQCKNTVTNSVCTEGTCQCKVGFKETNGACTELVDCGAPVLALGYTIDSGATTTEGSTVTVTCSVLDGYGGPGVNITCQTDGNWTAISGCFEAVPLNSNCTVDDECLLMDQFSICTEGTCQCDTASGYYETGSFVKSRILGAPSSRYCTIDCGNLTQSSGYVFNMSLSTTYGSTTDFVCDGGYAGSRGTVTCRSNGKWDNFTGCLVDCSSPSSNTAYLLGLVTNTTEGATVNVTCNRAIGFDGTDGMLSCQNTGNWSEHNGCIKAVQLNYNCTDDSQCQVADQFSICMNGTCQCDTASGYYETGSFVKSRIVGATSSRFCTIDCGDPSQTSGYAFNMSLITTYETTIDFVCDGGYVGSGGTIVCRSDGKWDNFTGCLVDCSSPLPNTAYILGPITNTTEGAIVNVTCNWEVGFDGTDGMLSCQNTGNWSEHNGCIKAVKLNENCTDDSQCQVTDQFSICTNETCQCDTARGYYETGSFVKSRILGATSSRYCTIECGDPSQTSGYAFNVSFTTTYETTINFVCDRGYVGSGGTIMCRSDGKWDNFTGCLADCSSPSTTEAYLLGPVHNTIEGATVNVTCNRAAGYNGTDGVLSCQNTGNWSEHNGCTNLLTTTTPPTTATTTTPTTTATTSTTTTVTTPTTTATTPTTTATTPTTTATTQTTTVTTPTTTTATTPTTTVTTPTTTFTTPTTTATTPTTTVTTPTTTASTPTTTVTTPTTTVTTPTTTVTTPTTTAPTPTTTATTPTTTVTTPTTTATTPTPTVMTPTTTSTTPTTTATTPTTTATTPTTTVTTPTTTTATTPTTTVTTPTTTTATTPTTTTVTIPTTTATTVPTNSKADCGQPPVMSGYLLTRTTVNTLEGDKAPYICDTLNWYCGYGGTIQCLSNHLWTNYSGCTLDWFCASGSERVSFITIVSALIVISILKNLL